ncbi:hypothetical protein FDP41_009283 [Naegleria fowleri]|uniref:Uncharacterized protein n=1 Tax=Naegleria fowleri TaxID=5763 RepID=A0A6A5BE78_NAEFO|nr:uncharacterized protein FDP41_009283 [Naegleria fowleri]KAF0972380.1 hypothetical protein FDP41_009283 [Naegleria fowleri]
MPNRKPLEFHNTIKFTRKDHSNSILASSITDCKILTNIDVEGLSHDVIKKSNVLKFEITLECKSKSFIYKPNRYYCLIELYDPKSNTLLCTQEGNSLLSKETMSTLYKINDQRYCSQLKVNIEKVNRGTRAIFKISLLDREKKIMSMLNAITTTTTTTTNTMPSASTTNSDDSTMDQKRMLSPWLDGNRVDHQHDTTCDCNNACCDIEWQSGAFLIQDRNSKKRKQQSRDHSSSPTATDTCDSKQSIEESREEDVQSMSGRIAFEKSEDVSKLIKHEMREEEDRVPLDHHDNNKDESVTCHKKKCSKNDIRSNTITPLTKKIKTELPLQIKKEKITCNMTTNEMNHTLIGHNEKMTILSNTSNKENIPLDNDFNLNDPSKDQLLLPMMMIDPNMNDHLIMMSMMMNEKDHVYTMTDPSQQQPTCVMNHVDPTISTTNSSDSHVVVLDLDSNNNHMDNTTNSSILQPHPFLYSNLPFPPLTTNSNTSLPTTCCLGFNNHLLYTTPIPPPPSHPSLLSSSNGDSNAAFPYFGIVQHSTAMNHHLSKKKKTTSNRNEKNTMKRIQNNSENLSSSSIHEQSPIPLVSLLCTSPLSTNVIEDHQWMMDEKNHLLPNPSPSSGNSFLDFSFGGDGDSCCSLLASLDGALTTCSAVTKDSSSILDGFLNVNDELI